MKEGGRPIRRGREAAREEGSGEQREYQTKKRTECDTYSEKAVMKHSTSYAKLKYSPYKVES